MKHVPFGGDAHAGLRETHPGHEGGAVSLPAESAMTVATEERRCRGHEAYRTAQTLTCEFTHGTLLHTFATGIESANHF